MCRMLEWKSQVIFQYVLFVIHGGVAHVVHSSLTSEIAVYRSIMTCFGTAMAELSYFAGELSLLGSFYLSLLAS